MSHFVHRPRRGVPQRAAPPRRFYGLHKNGLKFRGGRLKRERRHVVGNKNIRLYDSGQVFLPAHGLTVPFDSFAADLDEANLDGAHEGSHTENDVSAENLTTPSQLIKTHPLTKKDGRELADLILQRIQTRLSGRIRNLEIRITDNSVELTGECRTYYTKQMAQHVAMGVLDYQQLVNNILVC